MNNTATVFDIQRCSFSDGPGIRTTVFFKGCNLRCAWCHNPESQNANPQIMFYETRCIKCGKCVGKCPHHFNTCDLCGACEIVCEQEARRVCGKRYTVEQLIKECLKDKNFYETSGGGVTISGGECMLQIEALEELLKQCKAKGLHTAIDTAGYVPYEYFERIISYTDLFLFDIKCFDNEKHKSFTGVGNELIFDNLKKLLEAKAEVIIRIPVIEDVNDTTEEMVLIKKRLEDFGTVKGVELLPYHSMGEAKYKALSMDVQSFKSPSKDKIQKLKEIFEEAGK